MNRIIISLLLFLTSFSCQSVLAQDDDPNFNPDRWPGRGPYGDFEVDGMYYFFNIDSTAVTPTSSNRRRPRRVIPAKITYEDKEYPVYVLGPIFRYDDILEEVEFYCRMKEIYSFFENCYSLKDVILPDEIQKMGSQSFCHNKIKTLTLPKNLKVLSAYAIEWCSELETIVVNDSLEEMHGGAISQCPKVSEFRFPPSFRYLCLPWGGSEWKRLTFEDSERDIEFGESSEDHSKYVKLEGLEYLYYGRRTLDIGWYIPNLRELVIGAPVESLKLSNLEMTDATRFKIYAKSTSPNPISLNLGKNTDEIFAKSTLFVPTGTRELYMATDGWRKFLNIDEYDVTGVSSVLRDTEGNKVYNLQGQRLESKPTKGIYIQNRKKVVIK